MRHIVLLLILALTFPTLADPVEEVRQAEKAFAKAFADRDQAKFFSFVGDDATFLGFRTLGGKKAVVERWSKFFATPEAPFSWGPERVAVNAAGNIGLSTGPVYDPDGNLTGNFVTTWVKQADGSWKVLFDGGGSPGACFAESAVPVEEGFVKTDDGVRLHYKKAGNGPIAIIAPLEYILYPHLKQFADIGTIVTYDLRNRGRSDKVADVNTLTISQDIKDLEAVRRHFNVDKFVPVGYSYLGLAVIGYALEHPEHVTRIIQLGPLAAEPKKKYAPPLSHGYEDLNEAAGAAYRKYEEAKKAGMRESSPKEFCELFGEFFRYYLVGDPKHVKRARTGGCALENEWPLNLDKHMEHSFASAQNFVITMEQARKVTVPVLTIHGTKDRNAAYGGGREWAMILPDARLVTIEGAAHAIWADDPATTWAAVREFLRGNWPLGAEKVTKLER